MVDETLLSFFNQLPEPQSEEDEFFLTTTFIVERSGRRLEFRHSTWGLETVGVCIQHEGEPVVDLHFAIAGATEVNREDGHRLVMQLADRAQFLTLTLEPTISLTLSDPAISLPPRT